jgi:hypothetical protein
MKKYEELEMETIAFTEDVILTSPSDTEDDTSITLPFVPIQPKQ